MPLASTLRICYAFEENLSLSALYYRIVFHPNQADITVIYIMVDNTFTLENIKVKLHSLHEIMLPHGGTWTHIDKSYVSLVHSCIVMSMTIYRKFR